jgi:hypothetical protein
MPGHSPGITGSASYPSHRSSSEQCSPLKSDAAFTLPSASSPFAWAACATPEADAASRSYRDAPRAWPAPVPARAPDAGQGRPAPTSVGPHRPARMRPKNTRPHSPPTPAPNHTPYRSAPGSQKRSASGTRTVSDRRRKRSAHDPARTCAERSRARLSVPAARPRRADGGRATRPIPHNGATCWPTDRAREVASPPGPPPASVACAG